MTTEHTAEIGAPTKVWWKVRGETVGALGLLGDVMQDWGIALSRWSNRRMFAPRELDHLNDPTYWPGETS